MSEPVHAIRETFCVLTPDMALQYLPFTGPAFYEGLDARFGDFAGHVLMSCHTFNAPWPTWECHPAGDEMVLLMSGTVTLALKKSGQRRICIAGHSGSVRFGSAWYMAHRDCRKRGDNAVYHAR